MTVTVAGMDHTMSQTTRQEVLKKLRRRYQGAGAEHKRKLLDQAQELLGYHRKAAIRSLRAATVERGPGIISGRPVSYEPRVLLPWLRPIWQGTDYACGGGAWWRCCRSGYRLTSSTSGGCQERYGRNS